MQSPGLKIKEPFKHALVTGGAGFIGSRLVHKLLDLGFRVNILDNLSVGTRSAVDSRAHLIEGDVRHRNDVELALKNVDCVFHLAAQVSIRESFNKFYNDVDNNLMGTLNLLRCLDPKTIRHLMLASSMAVYADSPGPNPIPENYSKEPISPYGISKLAAECICKQVLAQKKIPFYALRYFNTFGIGQAYTPYVGVITIFITRLLQGDKPIIFGDGEQKRDFVHVDDIVEGTIKSLSGSPGIYNLGTGRATSIKELAEILIERIRPNIRPIFSQAKAGELRFSIADISAAVSNLDYHPKRSLKTEIDSVIKSIKNATS